VPVLDDDTPKELAARVLAQEHRIYPLALRLVASGAALIDEGRVVIAGAGVEPPALLWPQA
jgi:phosphoribosylglycinamide formyltransferase-1